MVMSAKPETAGPGPTAGGLPISEAVADQAAAWLTLLMSGEADSEDRRRWQAWRAADPDHERAWQHIEAVTGRMKVMQPRAAYRALSPYAGPGKGHSQSRRKAIRALAWGGLAIAAVLLAPVAPTWDRLVADHSTGTGEQRRVQLDDGSLVTLNTATAVVLRFDDRVRRLELRSGEVLVETAHARRGGAADPRPFVVETAAGTVRALGTRFVVRQWDEHAEVVVLENAVEIVPRNPVVGASRVAAGERVAFTPDAVERSRPVDDSAVAWSRGQLVADDMRLCDFLAELGRYRAGVLRCDPAVAPLRLSGVFPLQDTDRILASLPAVLPVEVRRLNRYWATVEAAR